MILKTVLGTVRNVTAVTDKTTDGFDPQLFSCIFKNKNICMKGLAMIRHRAKYLLAAPNTHKISPAFERVSASNASFL